MKKHLLFIVFLLFTAILHGQKNRFPLWFTPMDCHTSTIHGIAIGAFSGAGLRCDTSVTHCVNGLQVEIFGFGLLGPLMCAPRQPVAKKVREFRVNGIVISGFGFFGPKDAINGINLSGISTECNHMNGLSACMLISYHQYLNGISISLFNGSHTANGLQVGLMNYAQQSKGLQLGLVNRSDNLKGFQIGLWNLNSKRSLPLFNFSL